MSKVSWASQETPHLQSCPYCSTNIVLLERDSRIVSAMTKPTLHYFELRGRGEVVRLAFALKGVDFNIVPVDFMAMKSDATAYPFGQCPR